MIGDVASLLFLLIRGIAGDDGGDLLQLGFARDRSASACQLKREPAETTRAQTRQPLGPVPGGPTGRVQAREAIPFEASSNRFFPECCPVRARSAVQLD